MLVIGYGNRLRGDDGVGWAATEALMHRRPELAVQATHTLTPELAADIADAALVVFVDARHGDCPGHVHVDRVDREPEACPLTHGLSPAALVAYSERLFDRRPQAFLVTVEADRFDFGMALSPDVEHAIPEVLAAIEWLERGSRPSRRSRESASTAPR